MPFFTIIFFIIATSMEARVRRSIQPVKKDWTFIVYMAADNDLDYFSQRNLDEMKHIGSTQHAWIVVQLDRQGPQHKTKRYVVEKNNLIQTNQNDITGEYKLNSGSTQTLIDCCEWAIKCYPAHHYALIFWNHGTGILDGFAGRAINASELFTFNAQNHMLELNREINFIKWLEEKTKQDRRGVCFSDTYGSFLSGRKLEAALKKITQSFLNNKKIDIIGFDACLMAMTEIAHLIQPYAKFMVASQEVELATGWPYHTILSILKDKACSPQKFAEHIVLSYEKRYLSITSDFSQSAINLEKLDMLTHNIDIISQLFIQILINQKESSASLAIKAGRARRSCTSFSEPSYIDLHHFYQNILQNLDFITLEENKMFLITQLKEALLKGLNIINVIVVLNRTGQKLKLARGLSVYFPIHIIDQTYYETTFTKATQWLNFLRTYLHK